MVLTKYNKWN